MAAIDVYHALFYALFLAVKFFSLLAELENASSATG